MVSAGMLAALFTAVAVAALAIWGVWLVFELGLGSSHRARDQKKEHQGITHRDLELENPPPDAEPLRSSGRTRPPSLRRD